MFFKTISLSLTILDPITRNILFFQLLAECSFINLIYLIVHFLSEINFIPFYTAHLLFAIYFDIFIIFGSWQFDFLL